MGLLANGLTTWLARDAAESDVGRAIARALAIAYGVGVVLAIWGTLFGPFNVLGWIAVAFNLLLGAGFGYLAFMRRAIPVVTPPQGAATASSVSQRPVRE